MRLTNYMSNFNFLPEKFKKNIKSGINARLFYAGSIVFFVWMLIFGITILVNIQVLNIQNSALQENINRISGLKRTAEAQDLEEEINEFNLLLSRIQDIKSSNKHDIVQVIREIAKAVPDGVALSSLTFNSSTETVFLSGHAAQRTQVIALEDRLESSEFFSDVDSPLSNLIKSEDIDFQFTLILSDVSE